MPHFVRAVWIVCVHCNVAFGFIKGDDAERSIQETTACTALPSEPRCFKMGLCFIVYLYIVNFVVFKYNGGNI